MKTLFETKIAGFDIKLTRSAPRGRANFAVSYGQQFNCHLTYEEAAKELGQCIMHALTCEGKIDD